LHLSVGGKKKLPVDPLDQVQPALLVTAANLLHNAHPLKIVEFAVFHGADAYDPRENTHCFKVESAFLQPSIVSLTT
jgi:hypothetical protein